MHRGSYYAPRPTSLPSASSCCSCCLRVDSFHLIKGQLFVYLFICLFPVYSHSHGRWLDVHLITMRRWYGTPSDAPICSQGRGHKKLSCGYRSHCKDRWLWNVQRYLRFGLLQGKLAGDAKNCLGTGLTVIIRGLLYVTSAFTNVLFCGPHQSALYVFQTGCWLSDWISEIRTADEFCQFAVNVF